jgi:FkbM family methyltransferase
MIAHPVFERFLPYRHSEDDWTGAKFPVPFPHKQPELNEELFEWIALLEAVTEARGQFTMLELGAGFGRWGLLGATAARRLRIGNIDVRLIEAEPQHAVWAREGIALNGLADYVKVIEAALSNNPDPVPFAIDAPKNGYDAASWYGQAVVSPGQDLAATEERYFGHHVYRDYWFGQIYVPPITLPKVAEGMERIDLIDADLQGAETEMIPWMGLLTERVRLVHIGTHSLEIEAALREAFRSHGWLCQIDYSLQGECETPFGRVAFNDGVQTWRNPKLGS